MDIDLRSAQECVDRFITEMRYYDIPPVEVAFLTDSTEEDCDVVLWEWMYREADLYDPDRPKPYRPAKWLSHVTVEGWTIEHGPEASYVVTPAGECFWRFQPAHLATATKPMRPVSAVPLVGNHDSALITAVEFGRESHVAVKFEAGRIEYRIAELIPHFIAAMNTLGVAPTEQDFWYTLEGEWPDLDDDAVVLYSLEGDDVITRLPLTATTGLTTVGWLVGPNTREDPSFIITPDGSVFPLHVNGDWDNAQPPTSLTPISTTIHDDFDMRVCDAFLCVLEETLLEWGIELEDE